jgi:hypothetical protein
MIPFLSLIVVAALQEMPCEYVVDFGGEPTQFDYAVTFDFVARDGDGLTDVMIDFTKGTKPESCRDFLEVVLRDHDIATRRGPGDGLLIVVGMAKGKKSPIKSVTMKSDKAIPVQIRWVPLAPEKKK